MRYVFFAATRRFSQSPPRPTSTGRALERRAGRSLSIVEPAAARAAERSQRRSSKMPVDVAKAKSSPPTRSEGSWKKDDVILYHLGVGAGLERPTDAKELEYTYEKNLKTLPSFGVIPVFGSMFGMAGTGGVDINWALVLHGEQDIEIHRPIPTEATVENEARVADIFDKGKAALIIMEVKTREKGGEPLFTNRFSIFARGEGGFGGD